jgi:hypothetical protein
MLSESSYLELLVDVISGSAVRKVSDALSPGAYRAATAAVVHVEALQNVQHGIGPRTWKQNQGQNIPFSLIVP